MIHRESKSPDPRTRSARFTHAAVPPALALLVVLGGLHAPKTFGQQGLGAGFLEDGGAGADTDPLVSLKVIPERKTVTPGSELRIAVVIEVAKEWHIYHDVLGPPDAVGNPTEITIEAQGIAFGKPLFPKPEKYPQPGLGKDGRDTWIYIHDGTFTVFALGEVAPGASGPRTISVKLRGLACKQSCMPVDAKGQAKVSVGPEASAPQRSEIFKAAPDNLTAVPATAHGSGGTTPPSSGGKQTAFDTSVFSRYTVRTPEESRSFFVYVLFGLVAGFLLNFMPCVLPVISIKILSFVKQAGEDPRRVFRLGITFSAGILAVFLVLAALAAFAGHSWGDQFQSQTFLVVMIAIVFGFSLSLFGLYEVGVPQSVAGMTGVHVREGYADAFFKGVMATILATPCSGPFLGSTLAWALTQPRLVIFSIFTAIGVGMAVPYTLLTAKPAWLSVLPKPGRWMETFKHIMGFVLLLTVIYLMVSLKQSLLLFTVAFLLFVAIAAWAYGRYATYRHGRVRRLAVLGISLGVIVAGAWLSFGVFQGIFTSETDGLQWEEFDPVRLEQLGKEGRNVVVDWTANWCPNCKFVERFRLETEPVLKLFERKKVVALKADITHDTPETRVMKALQAQLGSRSIPFLAVFPADDPLRPYVLRDIYSTDDLKRIFEALPDGK